MGLFAEYEATKGGRILKTCSGVEHIGSRDPGDQVQVKEVLLPEMITAGPTSHQLLRQKFVSLRCCPYNTIPVIHTCKGCSLLKEGVSGCQK